MNENSWLDTSLYPDTNPPERLETLAEQVDFIARLCSAWDFGILPHLETVREVRTPAWTPAVEACRLLTSPAYHLLRRWHGLPPLPYLGKTIPEIQNDPCLEQV